MNLQELTKTAKTLIVNDKGLLTTDEFNTSSSRLWKLCMENKQIYKHHNRHYIIGEVVTFQ